MFDRIIYSVSSAGQMWKITLEGSDRIWGPFTTKQEALLFAKGLVDLNCLGRVQSQRKNGTFHKEYVYSGGFVQTASRGQFATV
jgi:hypothetical protein